MSFTEDMCQGVGSGERCWYPRNKDNIHSYVEFGPAARNMWGDVLARNLEVKIAYAGFGEHWCSKTLYGQSTSGMASSEEELPDFWN